MRAPGETAEDDALVLDGRSLAVADVARVARNPSARVAVGEAARERVRASRRRIEEIVARYREDYAAWESGERSERPVQDYGITTGFGEFKDVPVEPERLEELQRNLLRSHCVGLGEPKDADDPSGYFAPEVVRATLLIRANAFLGGYSGVREELLDTVLAMLHAGIVPLVPQKGSLGSSGDLCPLAHCFVVLLGEGRYVRVREGDLSLRPWEAKPGRELAGDLSSELAAAPDGAKPAVPSYKEGLALINGATVSTALLALAAHDAAVLADTADVGAALALEAACGCARAFDPRVHAARGHAGQIESAARIRRLVRGSRLVESAGAVQDAYSLRCAPVVHGPARDALGHVRRVVETEMNAATDNPLFFDAASSPEKEDPWDHQFADNWPDGYDGRERSSYSAGNFHGQPVAQAADHLAMACAELGSVAERRIQLLLDHHHNRNLPANLVARRGVRSGAMLLQYSAASLVTESRGLCHPASVDSVPTAANIEDHVAVATWAARKLRTVLANVEAVLAIELLVAAQALDWRVGMGFPPVPPEEDADADSAPRQPAGADDGRDAVTREAERFEEATREDRRPRIAARLGDGTGEAYLRIRELVEPILEDRVLAGDVLRLRRAVAAGDFAGAGDREE